jgi:hypothetical protein
MLSRSLMLGCAGRVAVRGTQMQLCGLVMTSRGALVGARRRFVGRGGPLAGVAHMLRRLRSCLCGGPNAGAQLLEPDAQLLGTALGTLAALSCLVAVG